jgi:hypothetical protein
MLRLPSLGNSGTDRARECLDELLAFVNHYLRHTRFYTSSWSKSLRRRSDYPCHFVTGRYASIYASLSKLIRMIGAATLSGGS